MRRVLMFLLVCVCVWSGYVSQAQCPTSQQFTDQYRQILLKPFNEQYAPLLALKKRWEACAIPNDSIYVGALLQLGQCYHANGNVSGAVQVVQQAVRLCQQNSKITRVADKSKSLYRLGVLYVYQAQIQQAIDALIGAVNVGRYESSASTWVGNAHLYLAYAYVTIEDYQQVITHADAGISIAEQLDNKPLMANLFRQKAQALRTLQRYGEAQTAIGRAINLIRGHEELKKALADDYGLLSLILGYKKQYAQAIHYAKLSYEIAEQTKYYQTISNLAISLGFLYGKIGDYKNAAQYCQYGIDQAQDIFTKAAGYDALGKVYQDQNQYRKAIAYYQQGIRILPLHIHNPQLQANPRENHIRLLPHKGILFSLIENKADTWLAYARATRNNPPDRLRQALDTYRVADKMIDFMRWEHTGQQSKLFWRQKTRGIYEQAIETCLRLNNPAQAFHFFEKSRAVMLADKLNELGARQLLSPQKIEQEKQFQQAVEKQQERLARLTPDSAAYPTVRADLLLEQERLDTFHKRLEATNPTYFHNKYDSTTHTLTDLQRYLRQRNAAYVTYFVGDSALYVLGVTPDGAVLRRQSVRWYMSTAQPFMALLADAHTMSRTAGLSRFRQVSHDLYRQLLAPLNLPPGRVIVSSDGFSIPFETLSRSTQPNDYALRDYAFSYVYSARLLLKKRASTPVGTGRVHDFLGMAPVDFAPSLRQVMLPGSDQALRAIGERFGASSTMLLHQQATRRAFQTQAPAHRIIHLFTHATADSIGSEPTLFFADSTLRLSELGEGSLPNAQLAVLAACKTGIGANQTGEGVFSLARGFSANGVPSVVTTLWSVQNEATDSLTRLFYNYLDKGLSKDEALQKAKLDWLKTASGASELPNYWAGLILVGDTDPIRHANTWLWWLGAGLVVAGGTGFWLLRKKRPSPESMDVVNQAA